MFIMLFTHRDGLDLQFGRLVLLDKPNEEKEHIENLRPAVLLYTFRKLLSTIKLRRIRLHVEEYPVTITMWPRTE